MRMRFARGRGPHAPGRMTNTEREYGQRLELAKHAGQVLWYRFEGAKLRLADRTWYTPDFVVMDADGTIEMHDVKGTRSAKKGDGPWVEDDAAVKIKVAAEEFPFRFVYAWKRKKQHGGGWGTKEIGTAVELNALHSAASGSVPPSPESASSDSGTISPPTEA